MTDTQNFEPLHELTATQIAPRFRIRVNVAKQSKGYVFETTIEADWTGDWNYIPAPEEHISAYEDVEHVLSQLHHAARNQALAEIARREALDAEKVSAG